LGREDLGAVVRERHRLAGTAALGMHEQLGIWRLGLPTLDVRRPDAGMDVALPEPDRQLAPGDTLEPEPEVHVRQEEDLAVLRDRLDDRTGVTRRAAVVALCLALGGRVHVRDDDGAGMLRLPVAEGGRIDRRGERATCLE